MSTPDHNAVLDALIESNSFVHVTASGAGTQIISDLWERSGASAWLSGGTFPYSREETVDFLGFTPTGVDRGTAIDLALEAYTRAYRYGVSGAVGLAITASVASKAAHRGNHRIHGAVVSDTTAWSFEQVLVKGTGDAHRCVDDSHCSNAAMCLLSACLGLPGGADCVPVEPAELLNRVLARPVFNTDRTRANVLPWHAALMPGAYDPPHLGHFSVADRVEDEHHLRVVHHITVDHPHKPALTAQQVLGRTKLLRGRDVLVSQGDIRYIDKAARFRVPLVVGVDALDRMFDPKWAVSVDSVVEEFRRTETRVFVADRIIDGVVVRGEDVLAKYGLSEERNVFCLLGGEATAHSSTAIRAGTVA